VPGPDLAAGPGTVNRTYLDCGVICCVLTQLQFRLGRSVALIVGTLTADSRGSRLSA